MKKDIVLFAMMTFSDFARGLDNTNAHVVRWLAKRADVGRILFVDFNQFNPLTRLKYAIKNTIFLSNTKTIGRGFNYRFETIDDKTYRYLGLSYRNVDQAIRKLSLEHLEVWSFNPFDISFLSRFPGSRKIFYAIDDWRKNKRFERHRGTLDDNYRLIGQRADVIFTPSLELQKTLWQGRDNVHVIQNAVELDFYQHPQKTAQAVKNAIDERLVGVPKPLIGYLGVLTPDRIDDHLVEYLLQRNPDKYFVFAGPVWGGFRSQELARRYANVRFIGMVYYSQMPYLLSLFDVCLIPHRLTGFIQSMNPKKLYEYLAAGKPVVSTPVNGTAQFLSVIYCAETPELFHQQLQRAVAEDSPTLHDERRMSVEPHSWEKRFEQIEAILRS